MSLYDLLPPNSTQLERDFSRSTSFLQRTGGPVPTIRTAKRVNIPDSVVPWLIYEYGLGELLPYITNQRQAIAEGVLWQRIRGTPESVRVALGWVGVTGLIEEPEAGTDKWAEYMLGLAVGTKGDAAIDRIVAVSKISSPVRSRLQRIYAVYDYRRFVLDWSLLSEGGPLSDHTGVRPRPDWPQISYGEITAANVDGAAEVSGAMVFYKPSFVPNLDRFILSHSIVDEDWHVINHPGVLTDMLCFSARYSGMAWSDIGWVDEPWTLDGPVVASSVTTVS